MSDCAALLAEQRDRWARGDRALVEACLSARPDLPADVVLDLVYQEVVLREEAGERPSLEEYARRFPALEADLRLHFEVHEALAQLEAEQLGCATTLDQQLASAPTAAPTRPSVPGYEILETLGQGGMGVVFAARQSSLDREVALKFMPPEAAADPEALRRFHREARTASSLNHPHICTIFDLGTHEGHPFIVMERVVGRTLAAHLGDRPPVGRIARISRQVAEALAAAHAAGIVHRDVKPANIMVRDDGYVKVVDFGLARLTRGAASEPGGDESQRGALVGTPRYMSPEQIRGDTVEPPSDVFSLGIVLHELLTGRHPFAAESAMASLGAIQFQPAPPPSAANPDVTPSLDALVLRMLAKDPRARPTMEAVVAALSREDAPRTGAWPAPPPRPGRMRSGFLIALAAVALVALLWLAGRTASAPPARGHAAPPSIIVVPFASAGDEQSAYFSAGVTEDITSMLTRTPDIAVLSHSAALAYKDGPIDPRRIGSELGVGYVLQGTVWKEASKVRIVAQLIDARTGIDVWAERFDRTGTDPWMLQDEIAGKIVVAFTGDYGQLKRAQYHEAWGADSTDLGEYDYYLRGHEFYMRFTAADNERAGEVWREGLTSYPTSALLQAKLGWYHFLRPYLFFTGDATTDYARAGELVRSALAQPHLSPLERRVAHWLFAYVSAQEGEYERALREIDATLALTPYDAFATGDSSTILLLAGKADDAIALADRSIAADPANGPFYKQLKGWALTVAGRHAEAVAVLKESIDLPAVPLLQAINYARLGRAEDARSEASRALRRQPDMTLARWQSANFYRDRSILAAQLDDLAAAGLR